MILDIKSILFIFSLNNISFVILIAIFISSKKIRKKSINNFLLSKIFGGLAFIGFYLRDQIPDFYSYHISNLFLIFGQLFVCYALIIYDEKNKSRDLKILVSIALVGFSLRTIFHNYTDWRGIIQTLTTSIIFGYSGIKLLTYKANNRLLNIIGSAFMGMTIINIFKAYGIYNIGAEYYFFNTYKTDLYHLYLAYILANIYNFGFFILLLEVNEIRLFKMNKKIEKDKIELNRLNNTKDKFFSIISHDLKGPMGSISGLLENLNEQPQAELSSPESKHIIEVLQHSSQNTYNLLMNLLGWAQTQTGQIEFNPQTQNITKIINETIDILSSEAESKAISIQLSNKQTIKAFFDENMIRTVIRNILSNAIKFSTSKQYIEINVEEKQTGIAVSIKDQGVGIADNIVDKIFDLDSKISSTNGTNGELGTGLGLILCKEFIEKNGGTISAKNNELKGTTFTFTLPKND